MIFLYEKRAIAIIGDIRDSRNLKERKAVQDKLKTILGEINEKYKEDIISKFLITLGDEFQGVLADCRNVLKIVEEIKMKLYPIELRFGIGVGMITTDVDSEMALGADGPGYYMARNAMNMLKENEKKNKTVISDVRIAVDNNEGETVILINTILELIKAIEQNWTDRQREIIWTMQEHREGQKRAAERLGIAQPAVHKALVKGRYYVYAKAIKDLERVLGGITF